MKKSKSLFKISLVSIAALHGINSIIDSLSAANNNSKSSGKYYHWKHGDIYYKKTGHGSPLLLIHDLTVFSSNYEWSKLINILSETHTVYALDLIGCGKSEKPEITYTNYFYVQMVSDFVKDIIGDKTDVIVTGLSSSFVLMANSMNQNIFGDIVIVNPKSISSLKKGPDEKSKVLIKLFSLPVIGKTAYYIVTSRENTEYYLTEKCFNNPFRVNQDIINSCYNAAHTDKGKGKMLLASIDGGYLNIDITNALKRAENNITLIFGENNQKKEDIAASYAKINSSVKCEFISNAGHLPQLESPEQFLFSLK